MNINLGQWGSLDSQAYTIQHDLEEHQGIMRLAGFTLIGPAVLLPEPGPDYPGSYQVWNPCINEDGDFGWVYIDPKGVALNKPVLPTAAEMDVAPSGD